MAMSKVLAAPFRKKQSEAKPVSEYGKKASPKRSKAANGASDRYRRSKRSGR
jgi:hypothetical protein